MTRTITDLLALREGIDLETFESDIDEDSYYRKPELNKTIAALPELFDALERMRDVLVDLLNDIDSYEKVNNLSPSPGRKDCWQSVTNARAALANRSEGDD